MMIQADSKEIGLHSELPCSHLPALIIINFHFLLFVLYVLIILCLTIYSYFEVNPSLGVILPINILLFKSNGKEYNNQILISHIK